MSKASSIELFRYVREVSVEGNYPFLPIEEKREILARIQELLFLEQEALDKVDLAK